MIFRLSNFLVNTLGLEFETARKIVSFSLIAIAGLIVLAVVLWAVAGVSDWNFNRGQQKKKEAVNAAIQEAKAIETNTNVDKETADRIQANVNRDTREWLDSTNVTDFQRAKVDRALENMSQARAANRNVNAAELERQLEGIQ